MVKDAGDGLATARLRLRRFTRDDLEWLHGVNSDPEVKRYMGGPATREQTEAMLHERILDYYLRHPGLGIWVTTKRDGTPIGFHLLNHIQGEKDIQVGYVLAREHWDHGYATEMCRALLRYGFATRGLPLIVAITDLPNQPSQRVLEKSGLQRNGERTMKHPAYRGVPMAWYEAHAARWLAEHSSP